VYFARRSHPIRKAFAVADSKYIDDGRTITEIAEGQDICSGYKNHFGYDCETTEHVHTIRKRKIE
jgi:hypothetical protein